jgi:hypothetical protein
MRSQKDSRLSKKDSFVSAMGLVSARLRGQHDVLRLASAGSL